jgi:hypothetical protein
MAGVIPVAIRSTVECYQRHAILEDRSEWPQDTTATDACVIATVMVMVMATVIVVCMLATHAAHAAQCPLALYTTVTMAAWSVTRLITTDSTSLWTL